MATNASASPRLKLAILGAGVIARRAYLPLLRTWPDTEVVGLFSRSRKSVEAACRDWQLDWGTTELDALLERRPAAAFVLTSIPSHGRLVQLLLQAGVDVYVEKPATESSGETRRLAELAGAQRRILMVGFNRRHAPLYRQARQAFAGRPIVLCALEKHRAAFHRPGLFDNFLDDTIHQIDLLRFFCGEAQALHTSYRLEDGRLASAVCVTGLERGGTGVIQASWRAGAWQERLSLHGGGLTVEVDAFRQMRVRTADRDEVYGLDRPGRWFPDLTERGFHGAVEHFLECVRTRQQPETDAREAARTQELLESLVRCAGEDPHPGPISG